MKIRFAETAMPRQVGLVVMVAEGGKLLTTASAIDSKMRGRLRKAIRGGRFTGKSGETLDLPAPAGIGASRLLAIGIGDSSAIDAQRAESIGGKLAAALNKAGEKTAFVAVDPLKGSRLDLASMAAHLGCGLRLASYRFDQYKTKLASKGQPVLDSVTLMLSSPVDARRRFATLNKVVDGVFLTRDLVSEPANRLFPQSFAERALRLNGVHGLKVEVLSRPVLEKLGMGALLGVAQGSAHEPKMVVFRYQGGKKGDAPLAFVGKGVTFDSGGISIKPSQGMEDMKWDMGGAGVVTGLMKALAGRRAKVNAVGILGLVENMPSGTAQRPGDVVTSMSGQTIEVLNTDAEGRLVLADALWYTQNRFKPALMIDLATLTGAIIISLGNQKAGLFSNNDNLAEQLAEAGKQVGESLWRFPLSKEYDEQINSDIADMKNIGGRGAGSITAAQFLQRFSNNVPWAHLDIAGVTWSTVHQAVTPKGGTGFGVRLLDRFVSDNYEK